MLLVQKFLETHTFKELQEQHGVYASFSKSGHKFSLNYDQIEAKESDPLAQECRGLILAREDGQPLVSYAPNGRVPSESANIIPGPTRILAYPMKRFFNYGQGSAANIDWSDPNLSILEKLDGTLCIIYWDPFTRLWHMATRSVPEADLLMDNGLFTFRTLFEKALEEGHGATFKDLVGFMNSFYTYCFELTTPYNRIVVNYPKSSVTLLAVRGLADHKELEFSHPLVQQIASMVPVVQSHKYSTMNELIDWVSSLNPMEHEGVVVKQGENRIKVKNAAYVAYNKVRDALGTSERNCMELILAEKDDDVIPMLPEEIVKNIQKLKTGLQKVIVKYDSLYTLVKMNADNLAPGSKKEFAIMLTKHKDIWVSPFFSMYDGKASSMKDFIMKNRKDGTWGNSFLDKLLELSKINSG